MFPISRRFDFQTNEKRTKNSNRKEYYLMKKRTMAQFLAVLILFSSVLSCEKGGPGENTPANVTPSQATAAENPETEEETEAPYYTVPDVDYNGEDFTFFVHHYSGSYHICEYNGILSDERDGDILDESIKERNRIVEDKLNIKIGAYVDNAGTQVFLSSIMANDNVYDTAVVKQTGLRSYLGSDGYLYNLRELSSLDLAAPWVNQNVNETLCINGKQAVMLNDICLYSMVSGGCLFFSKSLVTNYHLDDPYQLVYDGKWTLDRYIGLCEEVSADLNGDGEWDENDSFGMNGSPTVMEMCVRSSGIHYTELAEDGTPSIVLNNEKTIQVVDKMTALLSNLQVNLNPEHLKNKSGDPWYNIVLPMFKHNQLLFTFNWVFYALELRDMDTDFGIIPMPKYDETQEKIASVLCDNWSDFIIVPVTITDPEYVGNVLNAFGNYSQEKVYPQMIEKTIKYKTARDEAAVDMLDMIFRNVMFDMNDFYAWDDGAIYSIWTQSVNLGTNVFASNFEKIQKGMRKKMEKTITALYGG